MDMRTALDIAARGMRAQTPRLHAIAQALPHVYITAGGRDTEPDRRGLIAAREATDAAPRAAPVAVARAGRDAGPLLLRYNRANPPADLRGRPHAPRGKGLVAVPDGYEGTRGDAANLAAMQTTRDLLVRTIDLLK